MGDKKRYRLIKSWPGAELEDIYQWNGQGYSNQTRTAMVISDKYVEHYPDWFQLIEDKPEQKEEVFVWTDELVKEYAAHLITGRSEHTTTADTHLADFKQSRSPKTKEETKITINNIDNKHHPFYQFMSTHYIENGKLPAIKQAIEMVLNDHYTQFDKAKSFTEEDMQEARRRAFNAARLMIVTNENKKLAGVVNESFKDLARHQNADEYLNSLSPASKIK